MVKQLICVWAPSGHVKTSLLGTFLTGYHRATGKRGRLYNADGGWASIAHLQAAGALDVFDIGDAPYPFETILDVSKGAWPVDPNDPVTQLAPPTIVRYVAHCEPCNKRVYDDVVIKQTTAQCPQCKVTLQVRPRSVYNPVNGIQEKQIGVLMYEGLTGFSSRLMGRMSDLSASGTKIGEDVAVKFKDGQTEVAGASRSSYGIAQRRIEQAVNNTRNIPGIEYVLWTAHKDRGEDDVRRTPVFGPKLAGHAATDDAPRWFGPCFGVSKWQTGDKSEFRVYLTSFYETFNAVTKDILHICNSRIPTSVLNGVKDYYVFDKEAKGEFGAETFLWDVVQMIERKQKEAAELALKGKK
jgi:hypothetical protein